MVAVFQYANGLRFLGVAISKKDAVVALYKEHLQEEQKRYPEFYNNEWESKTFDEDAMVWYKNQNVFTIKEDIRIF